MNVQLIRSLVDDQEQKTIEYRRYLHENAELSFHEVNTSRYIREKMKEFGIPVIEGFGTNSVIADLDTGVPGPAILFRADIDALPIQEAYEWEHKSKNDGVMHACGHDTHAANLLSFAQILKNHPELLKKGRVRFCFQEAEEELPGGAVKLVADGVCEGIDKVFALHSGGNEIGSIITSRGHGSMNISDYSITVFGKGGHTAMPSMAVDPVACLMDIANAIQRMVPAKLDPQHTNIVAVSNIHAGNPAAFNIIPGEGMLAGTIRTLYEEDMDICADEMTRIAEGICKYRGCTCEVNISRGYPGLVNDDACMDIIDKAAEELGIVNLRRGAAPAGEDFAYFEKACPGGYFSLGFTNPEKPEITVLHHNPHFMVDESGMRYGLEMFLAIITEILGEE